MADIFVLTDNNGNLLPPLQQASVLAKYSRSPDSARTLLEQIDESKAESFQEKWIVGFGHSSIAELCSIPVCFEGVSIIASKVIERLQRPGVSEKSTRMQEFDKDSMYWPAGMSNSDKNILEPRVNNCFTWYDNLMPKVRQFVSDKINEPLDSQVVKRATFDALRGLLPAGIKTNLGINAYPRDISWLISYMLGSNNCELVDIGSGLKNAVEKIGGPLIRHTEANKWLSHWDVKRIDSSRGEFNSGPGINEPGTTIIYNRPTDYVVDYEAQGKFIQDALIMHGMDWNDFTKLMYERPEKCEVPDIFKTIRVKFDILMSYGSFRDLQRHRRCEQFVEPLGVNYGFAIPDIIRSSPFADQYVSCFKKYMSITEADIDDEAYFQYGVPIGFLYKFCFDMDLKELYYIVELRTQPQGHPEYRHIAYSMFKSAINRFPLLMQWCRPCLENIND